MTLLLYLGLCLGSFDQIQDAAQVLRVITAAHDSLHDVTFVFEGESCFVGPSELVRGLPDNLMRTTFQGTFAYRRDGATFLDVYKEGGSTDTRTRRARSALLGDRYQELIEIPDVLLPPRFVERAGGPGDLNVPTSPYRVLMTWYFRNMQREPRARLENLGFEQHDGRTCMKIVVDETPEIAGSRKLTSLVWVDMSRGGHPLKIEQYQGENLRSRTSDIRLERTTPADGAVLWLPVSGVVESFLWEGEYQDVPIFRETYQVLIGSIRLNRNLQDGVFTAHWDGGNPSTPALESKRRAFRRAVTESRSSPTRMDSEGVKEDLLKKLAEADRQSAQLEASSAAREQWGIAYSIPLALAALGTISCIVALYLRWRS